MIQRAAASDGLAGRVALIIAAAAVMITIVLAVDRVTARHLAAEPPAEVHVMVSGQAIAAEADVFRTIADTVERTLARRAAHPRTLSTFRALRAYPGAPPRIPHGLTAEELRTSACRTCHERGGYAQRFGAYAPITPHPEQTQCLQCHVGDDALLGIALPNRDPSGVCRQCHSARGMTQPRVAADWRPAAWPGIATSSDGTPPAIPHDAQLRGNCVACHAGPAAVAEIRTTHPERANCRQCHVQADSAVGAFTRPIRGGER